MEILTYTTPGPCACCGGGGCCTNGGSCAAPSDDDVVSIVGPSSAHTFHNGVPYIVGDLIGTIDIIWPFGTVSLIPWGVVAAWSGTTETWLFRLTPEGISFRGRAGDEICEVFAWDGSSRTGDEVITLRYFWDHSAQRMYWCVKIDGVTVRACYMQTSGVTAIDTQYDLAYTAGGVYAPITFSNFYVGTT